MRRLIRYVWTRLFTRSANEAWVTAKGVQMKIGEMSRTHLVNSLALVVRMARSGEFWYYSSWPNYGQIRHSLRPQFARIREQLIIEARHMAIEEEVKFECWHCGTQYLREQECDWCPGEMAVPV